MALLGTAQAIARGGGRRIGPREELPVAGLGGPDLRQCGSQALLPAGGGSHVDRQMVALHDDRRLALGELAHLPVQALDLIATHRRGGRLAGVGRLGRRPNELPLGEFGGKPVSPATQVGDPALPGFEGAVRRGRWVRRRTAARRT